MLSILTTSRKRYSKNEMPTELENMLRCRTLGKLLILSADTFSCAQYGLPFYLQYLARWPEYCLVAEGPDQQCMGYILGKAEGEQEGWHGHVTAVTVAPESRWTKFEMSSSLRDKVDAQSSI